MPESLEQSTGRVQLETKEPAIQQARLLREATEQQAALLKVLKDRLNCEQCHGTGTVYVQDGPDDAHGEPCDCDITARWLVDRLTT